MIPNDEKERIWQAYRDRKPVRVPVTWSLNPRVVVLDPRWNPRGISFEEYFRDAAATVEVQLAFMDYQGRYLNQYSDSPAGRPKEWSFHVDNQNIYDAAYFGCPVHFRDGQVADVTPILGGSDKDRIFRFDAANPLGNPFIVECMGRHERLVSAAARASAPGVSLKVEPVMFAWDGPLTIAVQLRGQEILSDLIDDPDYAVRLMRFIQRAAEVRNRALAERAGREIFKPPAGWLADDSIQLIGTAMYEALILPLHRAWYGLSGQGPHGIHLCGDSTRHFRVIHERLNVCSFDTGFPVDHGGIRKALGPDVEIIGGPEVTLLRGGTAEEVYRRTRDILRSGVMAGGRFVLREANNLPPCCPEANLAAMYRCCLDHGTY